MITISICMIVKDEEKILARCLDSLEGLAEEIIIVDTGSADRTKEIAGKYTDKVYDYSWNDDFAAARNFSCSKATMDYIYTADADEILDEENRIEFKKLKEVLLPEIEIVQMKYCNQLEYSTTYNFDEEYRPKLFKRVRNFQWIDPIHETLNINPVVYDSDIKILHKPMGSHAGRDFETFQRVISRGERLSAKLVHMYARELFIAGEEQDFLEAGAYFESVAEDESRSLEEVKEAQCVAARAGRLRKDERCFFKNAVKQAADHPCSEICYELGEYYFELEDYKEAVIWFYNAAYETEPSLNLFYGGKKPLLRLSDCYERLNDNRQAEVYRELGEEWIKQMEKC